MADAEIFGAESDTAVPTVPMEFAVEVRLMVPVPLTLSPPENVPAFVIAPAEVKDIVDVFATVPTAPWRLREPVVAARLMVVPVMLTPAPLFKLPFATMLNTLPAPELEVTVVVALESVR